MQASPAKQQEPCTTPLQNRVLERIARGALLDECLLDLLRGIEGEQPGLTAAICLFDPQKRVIERVVSSSLARGVCEAAAGLSILDPEVAPCALAARQRNPAVAINLPGDDSWKETDWGRVVIAHGYRHCRSTPVFDSAGEACATVVLLSKDPLPGAILDTAWSDSAAHLVSIAIERETDRAVLRASEERFRLAVDAAGLGVWDWNVRSGEVTWSERCRALFDLPAGEVVNIGRFLQAVHAEDRLAVSEAVRATLADRRPHDVEFRIPRADGSVRWISAKGGAFESAAGRLFVRGIAQDITTRKVQAMALAHAESTLRLAVEATGLGLWDWDPATGGGRQDARCRELFGGDLNYEQWKACIHADDRERAVAVLEDALRSDGPNGFVNEYRIVQRDGKEKWIAGFGNVQSEIRNGVRTVTRVIGANLDITARKAAELAVKQSAERFRFLADAVPHKIFTCDSGGRVDYLNRQWETYTGQPVAVVPGEFWTRLIHPDDAGAVEETWSHSRRMEEPFKCEYRLRRSDGNYRWHLGRAEPVFDSGGVLSLWIGTVTDVHDPKTAQLELADREQRFRTMANATPVLIWMADRTMGCTYFNRRWLEFTGRTEEMEFGSGWLAGVHPDDRKYCEGSYSRAFERREPFQIEYRLRRSDGEFRWLLDCGQPLFSAEGAFEGYIGGCVEIHERKELEDRLRAEESRSRLAMEAAGMGFWDWVLGEKIRWSPEHNRILGIPAARREGTEDEFFEIILPADRDRVRTALDRAMSEMVDFQTEFRVATAQGALRWIAAHGRALFDEESGRPKRMLGVIQDVTQRRASEDRVRRQQEELQFALTAAEAAREEAENASRAKDQFLAVLSHELRTPLTPVLMAVSTLRLEKDLPESVRFSLDMIQRNIRTEARLIDDLLDLTRIARNKLDFKKRPMDLQAALHEAIEICRADAEAAGLRLEILLSAARPLVLGDFARLQQVFWNLIKNAVKFTPAGGIIRISSENAGPRVRVTVEDNGIGISPDVLQRIFRPFEQGDAEFARQYGGLGLGLAISLASVEAHGGQLTAESDGPGQGARFVVELDTLENPLP